MITQQKYRIIFYLFGNKLIVLLQESMFERFRPNPFDFLFRSFNIRNIVH